jgi:glycine/sarcosine N-methyltransferase
MSDDVRLFYDELAADYDAIFADWDASVRRQGKVLAALLSDVEGPILDVTSGMGTQAIGLALAGRQVIARDLSPALIERGRREAVRLGAVVDFAVGDMRIAHADDAERFGAVIAMDNALPHLLTDQELRAALAACRAALRPDGRFIASLRDYDSLARTQPPLDEPQLLGTAPARRLVTQIWTWAADGRSYALEHLILRESPSGEWSGRARRGRYRALLRAELEVAARAAGLVDGRWLTPEQSGFYQPVFIAGR